MYRRVDRDLSGGVYTLRRIERSLKGYLLPDSGVVRRRNMLTYNSTLRYFSSSRLALEQNLPFKTPFYCILNILYLFVEFVEFGTSDRHVGDESLGLPADLKAD